MKRTGWFEEYKCGCHSPEERVKRDLPGYCPKHGDDRRHTHPVFTEPRKTIAQHALDYLEETGQDKVWFGRFDSWEEPYSRSGGRVAGPSRRYKAVMDALRRSPLFERTGYIRSVGWKGGREVLHPVFKPVDTP